MFILFIVLDLRENRALLQATVFVEDAIEVFTADALNYQASLNFGFNFACCLNIQTASYITLTFEKYCTTSMNE